MLIKSGMAECALALGFEQMAPGSLTTSFKDREPPQALWNNKAYEYQIATGGSGTGPVAALMFSNAGKEYCTKYGATQEHLAKIGWSSALTG